MEYHLKALGHLCRVCTSYISTSKLKLGGSTKAYIKDIQSIWDINIWTDEEGVHPTVICSKCLRKIYHSRTGQRQYTTNPNFIFPKWTKHSRSVSCHTCDLFGHFSSGGKGDQHKFRRGQRTTLGPVKSTQLDLPFELNSSDIFSHIHSIFCIREASTDHLDIDQTAVFQDHQHFFICSLCLCILCNPVYTDCQHSFCSNCLTQLFQYHKKPHVPCPICNELINFSSVKKPPNILHVQLQNLSVLCTNCNVHGNLTLLRDHQCQTVISSTASLSSTTCARKSANILSPLSAAAETLNKLAKQHMPGQPVPQKIKELTDKWTWLRLKASKDKTIHLRTRGMVIMH